MRKLVLPLGAAAVVGTAGFAYMAGGTAAPSTAGAAVGVISGVNVTDIHYYLCNGDEATASDPDGFSNICYVDMRVQQPNLNAPIPSSVDARIGQNGSWVACTRASSDDSDSNYTNNSRGFVCSFQANPGDVAANQLFVKAVG